MDKMLDELLKKDKKIIIFIIFLIILPLNVLSISVTINSVNSDGLNNSASNWSVSNTVSSDAIGNYSWFEKVNKTMRFVATFDANMDNNMDVSGNRYTTYDTTRTSWNQTGGRNGTGAEVVATQSGGHQACTNTSFQGNLTGNFYLRAVIYKNNFDVNGTNTFFVSKWDTNSKRSFALYATENGAGYVIFKFATTSNGVTSNTVSWSKYVEGLWVDVVGVYDGVNNSLYLDGVRVNATDRSSDGVYNSSVPLTLFGSLAVGACSNTGNSTNYDLIEVGEYIPSDAEILEKYNSLKDKRNTVLKASDTAFNQTWTAYTVSGNATNYSFSNYSFTIGNVTTIDSILPNVTLNYPLAQIITTNYTLFNCTAYDNVNLSSIKLYINGVVNQTNNSPVNNTPWVYNLSLPNGNYTWNCEANDTTNNKANGTQNWVYINYTAPALAVSLTGKITYNNISFAGANVSVINDTSFSIVSIMTTNSTGDYNVDNLLNNSNYLVIANFRNATSFLSSSGYTLVNMTNNTKNLEFLQTTSTPSTSCILSYSNWWFVPNGCGDTI